MTKRAVAGARHALRARNTAQPAPTQKRTPVPPRPPAVVRDPDYWRKMAAGTPGKVVITEPALHDDINEESYHADPVPGGSMSSTFARLLTNNVPAKALELYRNNRRTEALTFGKAAHAQALGIGSELIVWEHDGRTKAGKAERAEAAPKLEGEGAVAVTAAERDRIMAMAAALLAHEEVRAILEQARVEVSGFSTEGPVWLRSRYDLLLPTKAYDYKTAGKLDVSRRSFGKSLAEYGYHQQAEWYLRVLIANGHPAGHRPFQFICQETEPPYLVQIHTADSEAMDVAAALNDRAIRIYTECMATGVWPGYPTLTADPVQLPTYYFFNNEDVLPDTYAPIGKDIV